MAEKVSPDVGAQHEKQAEDKAKKNSAPKDMAQLGDAALQFEVFGPTPEVKTFPSGLTVSFAPFKVRQIKEILPLMRNLIGPLEEMFKTGELNITHLQELDGDALVQAVAIACDLTPKQVDEMELPEFVWCVTKIVTVNGDFFVQTLPKLLGGAAVALVQMAERTSGGLSSFNASSAPATPSTPSSGTH